MAGTFDVGNLQDSNELFELFRISIFLLNLLVQMLYYWVIYCVFINGNLASLFNINNQRLGLSLICIIYSTVTISYGSDVRSYNKVGKHLMCREVKHEM